MGGQKSSKIVGHHLCVFPKLSFQWPGIKKLEISKCLKPRSVLQPIFHRNFELLHNSSNYFTSNWIAKVWWFWLVLIDRMKKSFLGVLKTQMMQFSLNTAATKGQKCRTISQKVNICFKLCTYVQCNIGLWNIVPIFVFILWKTRSLQCFQVLKVS